MILSEQEFLHDFARLFDLPSAPSMEDRLAEDLLFDSLQLYECVVVLETTVQCELPSALIDDLESVGDLYHWYRHFSKDT